MSKGSSIFSSPNNGSSNGEAPANPFASLAAGSQKSGAAAASPFAAATPAEPESPFGFAAEEAAPERPKSKLPEKRTQAPSSPKGEDNPFQSAGAAPQAEPTPSAPAPAASPFTSESSFEAPATAAPQQVSQAEAAAQNPLSAPAPEPAQARQPVPATAPVAQVAPVAAAAAPSQAPMGGQSMRQLELRAIFGSEREMTRDEILTKAKALPGIRELTVVGPGETAAVQTIGDVMARFGFRRRRFLANELLWRSG